MCARCERALMTKKNIVRCRDAQWKIEELEEQQRTHAPKQPAHGNLVFKRKEVLWCVRSLLFLTLSFNDSYYLFKIFLL